jgi:predicted DNA-binding protein with PD1-like motif
MHSSANIHVIRLRPHADLKKSIVGFARDHDVEAGVIITCVGSLEQYNLRFANQHAGIAERGHFEIISLTGTFSRMSCHLHLSLADEAGLVKGGHLLDDNLVYTTAEIAMAELPELTFERVEDPVYGYLELAVTHKLRKNHP